MAKEKGKGGNGKWVKGKGEGGRGRGERGKVREERMNGKRGKKVNGERLRKKERRRLIAYAFEIVWTYIWKGLFV